MEESKNEIELTRKKIIGLIGLMLFCMIFIFACCSKILPIGAYIVGTFGIMTYPLSIVLALLSLAMFLGMSYTRSPKATRYFLTALFCLLFVIQAIATFSSLESVVTWKTLKTYLALSYEKTTLLGSFGSIFTGLVSMLLGAMGTIILFVILTTIFGGLFIDYQIYGKFEAPHIKKLKTKKVRERVNNSDRGIVENGTPNYSFSNGNDMVDEIQVDANTYENSSESQTYNQTTNYTNKTGYSNSDVVDEITDQNISDDDSNYGFGNNGYNYDDQNQTQNTFDNTGIYGDNSSYPNVYTPDMDEYRRQFMHATFGGSTSHDGAVDESDSSSLGGQESENASDSYQTSTPAFETPAYSNNFSLGSSDDSAETDSSDAGINFDTNGIDEEISKIMNTSEDDDESDIVNNPMPKSIDFGLGKTFDTPLAESTPTSTQNDFSNPNTFKNLGGDSASNSNQTYVSPVQNESIGYKPADDFASRNRGFSDGGFAANLSQNTTSQQYQNQQYQSNIPTSNIGSGSNYQNIQKPSITIPAKEQKPAQTVNIGMTGIRYTPPPLSLLKTPKPDTGDYTEEQNRKTAKLENVLAAFNIPAKVVNIVRGPKITRYELAVPLGISVKKIPSYEDDIAAALAAKTIVIKAPIPGSQFVGIELENDTFSSVYERELLESPAFQNCKDPLPIAIGKDISGEIVVKSLTKMVHLLIAGSTGSGKSVFIHNIVLSLIFKYGPDDLRLIMIDPKKVEFNRYNGLPHLLTPEVVMGSEKAINALKWCVKEMDRRYDLMNKAGYNNIEPYNKSELVKAGQFEHMPYIVIIVDELAEIMLANKKESEVCIQRITQLARACGMHLILATQRPSVDIISGVIKNNIPSRIAFSLQSGIDSKTILNEVGAEKLLGQGDMIFAPTGTSSKPRLQAAYASDDEIKAVIDYDIKYNQSNFDETVSNIINAEQDAGDTSSNFNGGDGLPPKDNVDDYFKVAVKLVMQNNQASISYLQRRLSIGYSRAARIVDQMEDKGYIAPANGAKVRKVLITPDQFYNDFGEPYDTVE